MVPIRASNEKKKVKCRHGCFMRELHRPATKIQRDRELRKMRPGKGGEKEETRLRPDRVGPPGRKACFPQMRRFFLAPATAPGAWEEQPALLQESEIIVNVKVFFFLWKKRCGRELALAFCHFGGKRTSQASETPASLNRNPPGGPSGERWDYMGLLRPLLSPSPVTLRSPPSGGVQAPANAVL